MYRELQPSDRPTPDPVATPHNGQGGGERPEWRDKGSEPGGRPEGRDGAVPRDSLSQGDQPARAVPLNPVLQGRSPCPLLCTRSLSLPDCSFRLPLIRKMRFLFLSETVDCIARTCACTHTPACTRDGLREGAQNRPAADRQISPPGATWPRTGCPGTHATDAGKAGRWCRQGVP